MLIGGNLTAQSMGSSGHTASLLHISLFSFRRCNCPRRDFAQKAKSRGRTLVTHAYIKENIITVKVYSRTVNIEKILICLNRGHEESVGNDDVSIVCARKSKWLG